jgi:hypothetical protein
MTTPDILNPIPVHETPSTPSTATPTEMASSPSTPDSHPSDPIASFVPRRRRGPKPKIAQLPPEQRALVNQLLDQDKTYEEVVTEMAKQGVSLTIDNVFNWYNGPYQEYLDALDWQEELQRVRDHAHAFGPDPANAPFQESLIQIALTHLLRDLKQDRYKDDPANSLRLFNALARLSREGVVLRKYADQCAKEQQQARKHLDPEREFNEKEHDIFLKGVERLFGFRPDQPIGPPLAEVLAKIAAAQSPQPVPTPPTSTTPTPTTEQ